MAVQQETLDVVFKMRAELDDMRRLSRETSRARKEFADLKTFLGRGLGMLGLTASIAGAVAMVQRLTRNTMDYAAAANEFSKALGVNVEWLQKWQSAAVENNFSIDQANNGLQRFIRRIGEAQKGQGDLAKIAEEYGIQLSDQNGTNRDAVEILRDFADVIASARTQQERLSIANKMFDSEQARLVLLLQDGAAAFDELIEGQSRYLDEATIARLTAAQTQLAKFERDRTILWGQALAFAYENAEIAKAGLGLISGDAGKVLREINSLLTDTAEAGKAVAEATTGAAGAGIVTLTAAERRELESLEAQLDQLQQASWKRNMPAQEYLEILEEQHEALMQQLLAADGDLEKARLRLEIAKQVAEIEEVEARIRREAAETSNPWADFLETMQDSVVSTHNLADALTGVITQTKTWGDVGRSVATLMLNALIQLGLEMVKNAVIARMAGETEKQVAVQKTGVKAVEGGMQSIAQLGPIFGPLAFAGALAAVTALAAGAAGGFARGGYVPGAPVYGRDNRLAMVGSGEAIIPTAPAQRFRPMIEDMIAGREPRLPAPIAAPASSNGAARSASGSPGGAGGPDGFTLLVDDRQAVRKAMMSLRGDVTVIKRKLGIR